MIRHALLVLLATCLGHAAASSAAVRQVIVTASERGTYFRIGQDLARYVAPAADIDLVAATSAGSVENVRRLRSEQGVKFALVQSDVYQGYLDMAAAGNRAAAALVRPLRVILPLYNEEICFVVRADAPWSFVHEIRGARINAGETGSGTALTTATLYRLMFGQGLPDAGTTYLADEQALVRLVTDRSVDVVVIVGGQPTQLLARMGPEARQHVKLLRVDPGHGATKAALKTYFSATVRRDSYPNLLEADLPALAVRAFLVTYDFQSDHTESAMRRFARSLCDNFASLKDQGHPKWREVEVALPQLGRGWSYYGPTSTELRKCRIRAATSSAKAAATPRPTAACSQQERLLGLCAAR
ncbi:MAG TPA: TAXI family TRAP transporter solute-binding subunit [Casimicrobiaceae bacterium]